MITSTRASTAQSVSVQHTHTHLSQHRSTPPYFYFVKTELRCTIICFQASVFCVVVIFLIFFLICVKKKKKRQRFWTNSPNLPYKPEIDGTKRGDRSKLTPVMELLFAAATCCGKRISVSLRQHELITATLCSVRSVSQISLKCFCFVFLTEVNLNPNTFHSIES